METQEKIMAQNNELQEKMSKMEEQMAALMGAITTLNAKFDNTNH